MVARRRRRIRFQRLRMEIEVGGVEAEAVDPALQPEFDRLQQRILDLASVQVEVGLLGEEIVEVVLAPARVPLPCRPAEDRQPVVGRRTVRLGIGPDVPVGLRVRPVGAALLEPGVLVGGVRQHLVDDHLEAEPVRLRHQRVEIGQRPEDRVDVDIVGNVVAEVLHRRDEEGRDPHRVDAEVGDVAEPARDAGEVADAVAVRVLEGAWIDLVDDGAAPPVGRLVFGHGRKGLMREGIASARHVACAAPSSQADRTAQRLGAVPAAAHI